MTICFRTDYIGSQFIPDSICTSTVTVIEVLYLTFFPIS